jgi:hypothetical protein
MTQNEKDLLLKDLTARLSYGVHIHSYCSFDQDSVNPLYSLRECNGVIKINDLYYIEEVKPYLFPLSSMTEEQYEKFIAICGWDGYIEDVRRGKFFCLEYVGLDYIYDTIDWFNKNHFDYRGLIDKGLAIDATNKNIY